MVTSIDASLPPDKAIPLGLITTELVTNAVKHAAVMRSAAPRFPSHPARPRELCVLSVKDDGPGLPPDADLHGGIGLEVIRALAVQLGGGTGTGTLAGWLAVLCLLRAGDGGLGEPTTRGRVAGSGGRRGGKRGGGAGLVARAINGSPRLNPRRGGWFQAFTFAPRCSAWIGGPAVGGRGTGWAERSAGSPRMTSTPHTASDIPRLRRFARALTGSQAAGDAHVAALLEAVVENPNRLPLKARSALSSYALFCGLWLHAEHSRLSEARGSSRSGADARLAALLPDERAAFLLHQLEGFSVEDTAAILETTPDEVEALLDAADADVAQQIATRVLIIEDEPLIALDLERLVTGLGHRVVAIARTRSEALAAIKLEQPGLVLADIQLADGSSGAAAVDDILQHCSPPVVFITAFPERLLTGTKREPTYLLTKPYDPEAVKTLVSQALFFDGDRLPQALLA